jgi:hypothetical protein
MAENRDAVEAIRSNIEEGQRVLIDRIWQHHGTHGHPLPRRVLHAEQRSVNAVEQRLKRLGGSIVYQTEGGGDEPPGYALTLLGVLLTSDGPRIERVLAALLAQIRRRVLENPECVKWDREAFEALCKEIPDASELLPRVFRLRQGYFLWSGNPGPESMNLQVPDHVINDVIEADDTEALVRRTVGSSYKSYESLRPPWAFFIEHPRDTGSRSKAGVDAVTGELSQSYGEGTELLLREAESVLRREGPASAIDRVHTGLHSMLLDVLKTANIIPPEQAELGKLIELIRTKHPAFEEPDTRPQEARSLLRTLANVVTRLDTLRNNSSSAHPTDARLGDAEGMLAINSSRTLMYYIDGRIQAHFGEGR